MRMIKKLPGREAKIRTPSQENVIPARCTITSENFDIALGYEKGKLTMLSGVKTAASPDHYGSSVQSSRLRTLDLSDGLVAGRTYHCPICGNKAIVRCGKCHRITCYNGKGKFKCAYCGNSGKVSGTIQSIKVYSTGGMKRNGIKTQSGLKYYPGDK